MINLLQLRVFQAVARTSSFTRAADVVHLTQPGISKHIKQMEESFGTPLFDRSGRKATLTEAGAIFFEATQRVMAIIDVAEQRIESLKGLRGGRLRLGTSFPISISP
jgi:DNA-binding transcriptional LysR family regulator